jgi:rubredoxin
MLGGTCASIPRKYRAGFQPLRSTMCANLPERTLPDDWSSPVCNGKTKKTTNEKTPEGFPSGKRKKKTEQKNEEITCLMYC